VFARCEKGYTSSVFVALASGGEPALVEMASIFRTEIDNAMALIGVSEIGDVDRRFCRLA